MKFLFGLGLAVNIAVAMAIPIVGIYLVCHFASKFW